MNGSVDPFKEVAKFTDYADFKQWCSHNKLPRGYAKAVWDFHEKEARDMEYKRERRHNIFEDGDPIAGTITSPALLDLRFDAPIRKTLVLVGPAGSGKVRWVLENSPKPIYIIRSPSDLRGFSKFLQRFPGYIKSMLFIQMDFKKYPYNEQRNVVESQVPTARIPYHGHGVKIPVNIQRTFVWSGDGFPFGEEAGVRRRMHIVNTNLAE
ncbi:uncharacterized protein EV422DRAFT_570359 [Fimicolochytrium jonesii]|uniref:uncharacterized protein n=1 Tax=Fimicolochytrium jonesii TaxID=1396493 RepID=UPI0022FED671|nr:uncharacterized protein EV422DRAFT_570359 [Fimicolochytrium jonesii]KAI8817886.1 hypothetical protein EV422DRAFT_570359 [Fimicolochytrium jonesii]